MTKVISPFVYLILNINEMLNNLTPFFTYLIVGIREILLNLECIMFGPTLPTRFVMIPLGLSSLAFVILVSAIFSGLCLTLFLFVEIVTV